MSNCKSCGNKITKTKSYSARSYCLACKPTKLKAGKQIRIVGDRKSSFWERTDFKSL